LTLSITAAAQYRPFRTFIPTGYTILGRAAAVIDGDGYTDWVVALRNPYEKMNGDTTRPLLLLKGNGRGGYHLLARNDSVVLCYNCGGVHGDPFERVTAGKGRFSIRHFGGSGWRWTRVITFRYDSKKKQLLLASDGGRSWHGDGPKAGTRLTNRPEDFGRVTFSQFSYNRAFEKK
jgi:hypothetical protein